MPDLPVFQKKQFEFSAYIRDPQQFPLPPDVEPRRMAVYRELFFNNVEGFLSSTFPVLKSLLPQQTWLDLIQDYFSHNRSQSPYFTSIPEQFIQYLSTERVKNAIDLPFIQELAHYEWVEMALMLAEGDVAHSAVLDNETLLSATVRLSDLAWPLVYQYPVHQISPDYQPEASPDNPTYLVVYRDLQDEVKFMEINSVTHALLDRIENHPETDCQSHLQYIIDLLNHPQPEQALEYGVSIIKGLIERSIIEVVAKL